MDFAATGSMLHKLVALGFDDQVTTNPA